MYKSSTKGGAWRGITPTLDSPTSRQAAESEVGAASEATPPAAKMALKVTASLPVTRALLVTSRNIKAIEDFAVVGSS